MDQLMIFWSAAVRMHFHLLNKVINPEFQEVEFKQSISISQELFDRCSCQNTVFSEVETKWFLNERNVFLQTHGCITILAPIIPLQGWKMSMDLDETTAVAELHFRFPRWWDDGCFHWLNSSVGGVKNKCCLYIRHVLEMNVRCLIVLVLFCVLL